MRKLNYILSNPGKFHHFEVGKILYKRNQLKKIICGYPWFKLKNESIPKKLVASHGFLRILQEPIISSSYFNKLNSFVNQLNAKNIDRATCNHIDNINDIDVLLALSGSGLNSGKKMVKNNKIYICERGSSHIIYQNNILSDECKEYTNKNFKIDSWVIERELEEYENADIILTPSNFVKKTFEKFNISKAKVLNYGVNTESFFKDSNIKKSQKYFDILFIGQISLRKGLHYLIDAFHKFKHPNKRLHIVGSHTLDKDFFENKIKGDNIIYYGHVDYLKLNNIVNKSHILVLPSIEDGFGLVVLFAIAAGCPVIASVNTGASEFAVNNKCGFSVPIRDANAITDKLEVLAENKNLLHEFSNNAENCITNSTWSNYVDRLDDLIIEHKQNK